MPSRALVASSLVLASALAGCGSDDSGEPGAAPETATTKTQVETATVPEQAPAIVALYFLREGKIGLARRSIVTGPQIGSATMRALLDGPTAADKAAGLTTAVPSGTQLERLAIEDGVAEVELSSSLGESAAAQVVYTLTQFPTVRRVELDGEERARGDFEELTPAVLVESPAPGEEISSPLRIAGTANTFEATFQVEVLGAGRRVLGKRFVTATSGSGTRGTFAAPVRFDAQPGPATLVVYELSAEDGSRIHEVEIPVEIGAS
jgi:germination protein M